MQGVSWATEVGFAPLLDNELFAKYCGSQMISFQLPVTLSLDDLDLIGHGVPPRSANENIAVKFQYNKWKVWAPAPFLYASSRFPHLGSLVESDAGVPRPDSSTLVLDSLF